MDIRKKTGFIIPVAAALFVILCATFFLTGKPSARAGEEGVENGVVSSPDTLFNEHVDSVGDLSTGLDEPGGPWGDVSCDFTHWIGQPVDKDALDLMGRPFRILPPGSMMTMDHSPERINVHTDETGTVIDVTCG